MIEFVTSNRVNFNYKIKMYSQKGIFVIYNKLALVRETF